MTEAIYKVGDILEFTEVVPSQFGSRTCPVRGLVIKISNPGYEYLFYRLLVSGPMDGTNDMMIYVVTEKDILHAAKRIGHVDISALMFMENDEPDYLMMFSSIMTMQCADLRQQNEKLKVELAKETLKRIQAGAKCEEKVKENESLSNENKNLKAMNDELRSSWIECCTSCKQTEENKKLEAENEPLKRENEELRAANKKLAEVNARYLQSMTCAEKQMTEAAKRIYEAREHMNVAFCNN